MHKESAGKSKVKVLHLATIDLGGAYKAAVRISESMQKCGVDSEILIRTKVHDDTQAMEIFKNPIQKFGSKAKNVVNLTLSKKDIISDYLGTDVSAHPMVRDADVLVLHWVNSFLSYRSVEKLLATGKTVIWVMHDMWTFTGGCHYDGYCGGYAHDCGNCPHMESRKENDLSRRNFVRKTRAIKSGKMIFVGPSQWSVDCAGKSRITEGQRIVRILNPVNRDVFYRRDNIPMLKKKYGIPADRKIILFGATQADNNKIKGMQYLDEALCGLSEREYAVVIFGNQGGVRLTNDKLEVRCLGPVKQEDELAEIYSCADVFAAPSLQEAFGYTVSEALSCRVPVAAFAVGGIKDQVRHLDNGYLAPAKDARGLLAGIRWCTDADNQIRIRQAALPDNDYMTIGSAYEALWNNA